MNKIKLLGIGFILLPSIGKADPPIYTEYTNPATQAPLIAPSTANQQAIYEPFRTTSPARAESPVATIEPLAPPSNAPSISSTTPSSNILADLSTPAKIGLTLGFIALSSTLDKSGDSFALKHKDNTANKAIKGIGNILPFVAMGGAALAYINENDQRLSRTGLASLQAGGLSAVSGFGLKYVFARSRPEADLGPSQFHNSQTAKGDSSFPSIHTATTWGAITPFAKEYDMPWLYGVAALANYGRIADRKHWVSDTMAGSALGYWLGSLAWENNRLNDPYATQVMLGDRSVMFNWPLR